MKPVFLSSPAEALQTLCGRQSFCRRSGKLVLDFQCFLISSKTLTEHESNVFLVHILADCHVKRWSGWWWCYYRATSVLGGVTP